MSGEEDDPTPGVKTEWLKIGRNTRLFFVGNDVVAFGGGSYIILYNITTQEEIIYKADSKDRGEGVQCLVGYQQAYMFAFAEVALSSRIFLVKYPSLEHICVLQDDVGHTYAAMCFAEMECLVCSSGVPTFEIVVWCWRTGEKLASQPTGIKSADQSLRCSVSLPIGASLLAKHEREGIFQLWQISICSKLCLLTKTELSDENLEEGASIASFCWSPEGALYIADTFGSLYLVKEDTNNYVKVFTWPYKLVKDNKYLTTTRWFKGGIVMSGPNGFIQFIKRVSNTEYVPGWAIKSEGPLRVMAVNRSRDMLVGWSHNNALVKLNVVEQTGTLDVLKHCGVNVQLLAFIHPLDEYLATMSVEGTLYLWIKETGELAGSIHIERGYVLDMDCNPKQAYLALGRNDGILQIMAVTKDGEPYSLAELWLCKEEITGVTFNASGTLILAASYKVGRIFVTQGLVGTGQIIHVLDHALTNNSIVNMTVLSSFGYGDRLVVLLNNEWVGSPMAEELVIYELPNLNVETTLSLETAYSEFVSSWQTLLAVPYLSRQIHSLDPEVESGNTYFELKDVIPSGHQIRRFHIKFIGDYLLSFGWDGLIILRQNNMEPVCIFAAHHRFHHGVKTATMDIEARYIVSLGKEGNLVCTKIDVEGFERKPIESPDNEPYFKKTDSKLSALFTRKTWLEIQSEEKLKLEASAAEPEIKSIVAAFQDLQKEVVNLLEENYKAPPEEQLDILEFDLDTRTREEMIAEAAIERENTQRLLEAECFERDRLADIIKTNTWDTMSVKSRCIKAMKQDFNVDNYGLPPEPANFEEQLTWEQESRKLTIEMSEGDHFEPWFPFPEQTMVEKPETEKEEENPNPYLLNGSSSYQFVEVSSLQCSQFEMCSSFNNSSEICFLKKICYDLQIYFNKLFDEMFIRKEREMALLAERNARLRTILSELRVTCNAPMDVEEPVDAQWTQEEKTERIITVEDSEVPEMPYISPSEQAILDEKAAEEERIRQLLAADNFRELALIEMMDGMLEIRWEDELKKDVPKPKCMLEKDPADYSDADLKAVKDYEDKYKILQSERERYRKMLEIEYKKLEKTIEMSLTKFDSALFELLQTRLKVEAAMNQEQLKILRIHQLNDDRIRRAIQERDIINKVAVTENESEAALKRFAMMQEATNECRANYESLIQKDKTLVKKFKQEFSQTNASPAVVEQLVKYFRRRPKLQQRATLFPTLLRELARCVVEVDNSSFMPSEFHEFLTALDVLDQPSSATTNFDDNVWATLVRVRRAKIESELKVRAYGLELKEAEYTVSVVTKQMKTARDRNSFNVMELQAAREDKIRLSRDLQIQLVMKQGYVETPLTGHISDFRKAVLINPKLVERINEFVKAAGAKKLEAMKQVTKYHRINKYKEWEYRKMKMECEDLQEELNNIRSIKVTLEVKQYMNSLNNPKEKDLQDEDTAYLKQIEDSYKIQLANITEEINKVDAKIESFKKKNTEADRSILELKCDITEQQFERDMKLEESISEAARRRMAMIVRRSQLVTQIQQVHSDNLVLQTELELLRLRTYPTLKYKAPV